MPRRKPGDEGAEEEHERVAGSAPCSSDERGTFWSELGLSEPEYRNDDEAPAVNRELLTEYVRGELSAQASQVVSCLIDSFKCWSKAHAEAVANEYVKSRSRGHD